MGKCCPGKCTWGIIRLTTDVAKHQNVHIDQNSSHINCDLFPVRRDFRSVVSFRFNSWGISKDELVVEEMSVGSGGLGATPSETLVVGEELCVVPSETLIPGRTGTIGGVVSS